MAFSNPAVRRVQFAWGANFAAEWAYYIALEVFAFRVGGAFAVGLVGVLSELPAALAAPLTALLGTRYRREWLLFWLAVVRTIELCAAALAYARGAPPWVFYGFLAVDSVLSSAVFPNSQGLLPRLTRSRSELASAAAVTALVETIGGGIGPVLGGVLLAATNLGVVYVFAAGLLLSAGILFVRAPRRAPGESIAEIREEAATDSPAPGLSPEAPRKPEPETPASQPEKSPAPTVSSGPPQEAEHEGDELEEEEPGWLIGDFIEGVQALRNLPDARLLLALFAIDGLMEGALDVFVVVLALKTLGIGAEGVGGLAAVETVGGLIGGLVALNTVGIRGLAVRWTMLGVLDAMPPLLLAAFPTLGVVIVALLAWEAIDTLDEGVGLELLRRVVPEPLMPQALGLEDSVVTMSIAAGAIIAPTLVVLLGISGALFAIGVTAPLLVLATLRGMRRIDEHTAPRPAPT
jgi:MFS family permease